LGPGKGVNSFRKWGARFQARGIPATRGELDVDDDAQAFRGLRRVVDAHRVRPEVDRSARIEGVELGWTLKLPSVLDESYGGFRNRNRARDGRFHAGHEK